MTLDRGGFATVIRNARLRTHYKLVILGIHDMFLHSRPVGRQQMGTGEIQDEVLARLYSLPTNYS